MNIEELNKMNELMKSLEKEISEIEKFNEKLKEIAVKKGQLEQFYEEKWMDYYDEAEKYDEGNLEILNQDSLWNAVVDADYEARELIKNAAKLI